MADARRGYPELKVEGLTKTFPGTRALDDLTLELRTGEIHAIVGENGAGKTTLLMVLSGVYAPDSGAIRVRRQEVEFAGPKDAQAVGIGTVFQELSLVPGLSVSENVFLSRAPTSPPGFIDRRRMARETRALLELLGSDLRPDARVGSLSLASRQIVEIAKALSLDARILLLDEPTSALSAEETAALFAVLRRLKERGIVIVFVSHRLSEVFEIADRITVLRDGRLVTTFEGGETDTDTVVRSMVGRVLSTLYPERAPETGEAVLELRALRSGDVGPVDLTLHSGEILGLAGLRGAGRSRLARAIFGAERVDGGEVRIAGRKVRLRGPWHGVRRTLAFVPSDRHGEGVFARMTVAQNLVSAALSAVSRLGWVSARAHDRLADRLRREFGVRAASLDQTMAALSGGNQQKALLAKWLAVRPRVLLVDEPTQGIDVGAKAEIHNRLRELASDGLGVLLISSDLPEVLGMCDRIAVMAGGTVRGVFAGGEATEEDVMRLAAGEVER